MIQQRIRENKDLSFMPSTDDLRRLQAQQQSDAIFPYSPAFAQALGSRRGQPIKA